MTTLDLSEFARELAVETKAYVTASLSRVVEGLPALVREEVARALAVQPVPKDGRDGINGKDGVDGSAGKDGVNGVNGKDGVDGLAGKDGKDGLHGKDLDLVAVKTFADAAATTALAGLPALVRAEIDRAVTALPAPVDLVKAIVEAELKTWPRPKDGAPGPPGRDGTLEEVTAEHDGERTVTLVRKDGSRLVTITLPIPIDRGVWKPGTWYGKGDGVTWGGSFWIAQEATNAKPGESGADSRAWRLAVKRGTDGKAGRDGKDRE
jgi:integrin beta 3